MSRTHPSQYAATITQALVAKVPVQDATELATFTDKFWQGVVADDLVDRSIDQDTQLTWEAWEAFASFDAQRPVVDVAPARYGAECSVVKILTTDMPFITDSVLLEISRQGLNLRYLHNVTLQFRDTPSEEAADETLIFVEVDLLDAQQSTGLVSGLEETLSDVAAVVTDHVAMREKALNLANVLGNQSPAEYREASEFLNWLCADHFTFLGFRSFDFTQGKVRQKEGSELGFLTRRDQASERELSELKPSTLEFLLEPTLLSFSKAGSPSRVHRPAYPDYVGVKRFDSAGNVIGEDGFLGLYTSPVYTAQPNTIPVLRQKVANVMARSGYRPKSFDAKALAQVLATYPRDELLQSSEDELFNTATDIAHLHERRTTKVFLRPGRYGLFYTCLVYLPRDLLNTRVRTNIANLLRERLQASDLEFDSYFSESVLVRLQFILRVDPNLELQVDLEQLQSEIVALSQDWNDELVKSLPARDRKRELPFVHAMPLDYQQAFAADAAREDIRHLVQLSELDPTIYSDSAQVPLTLRFYRRPDSPLTQVNLKLFVRGELLRLTRVVPVLEHLGFEVISEHPYAVQHEDTRYTIQDFLLQYPTDLPLADIGESFKQAFTAIWFGHAESDAFNRLILAEHLPWRDVVLLRAYAGYMRQASFGFERSFIAETLSKHGAAAKLLVQHFYGLLEPGGVEPTRSAELLQYLEEVPLLNEDRVLRLFMQLIDATLRSNFFQAQNPMLSVEQGAAPLVFKLAARELTALPLPRPLFEIYVYAPDLEGVHLRSSAIARGGIRWSDRLEDYRTEVLGLVKAQIVKNAVIVPSGAKGGFVVKTNRNDFDAAGWQAEGVRCYSRFISGLLSLSDNLVEGEVVPPLDLVRRDGDDPYLVVAADKGTATFSDIANGIALQQNFWLGDAFASGGSVGYDHKKMGITAKGAWVSVQRHFRRLGVDPQADPITAIGIGDMGGDVFGNGMLRSQSMCLLAAFNHLHIFIDPNPNAAAAFAERQRLFDLPRSSWEDYNSKLISVGGGIFSRTQKSIPISSAMQQAFAIEAQELAPDELLRALLQAPVDLLWNGGIGTYIKATAESHAQVGDRANDVLRVNGSEVRARVIGEGGNLGLTHKGRIEFAQTGGLVNADFIDNAGGVDCSDHEVNVKIYLDQLTQRGELDGPKRNEFLLAQQDAVSELVLANNFLQARCLSLAMDHSEGRIDEYNRLCLRLEQELEFDRNEADFPSEELLDERQRSGSGLLSPELSTLLGYAKILLKQQLQTGALEQDPVISKVAAQEFPAALIETYPELLASHRLRDDIIITLAANRVIGYGGITLVNRVMAFTGCDAVSVVKAYWVLAELFQLEQRIDWLDALDAPVEAKRLALLDLMRWLRRSTRWFVHLYRDQVDVAALQAKFAPLVASLLSDALPLCLSPWEQQRYQDRQTELQLEPENATEFVAPALGHEMFSLLPIAFAAAQTGQAVESVAATYQALSEALDFAGLNEFLVDLQTGNHWRDMERDALQDDLCQQQLELTICITNAGVTPLDWLAGRAAFVTSWRSVLADVRLDADEDLAGIAMTVRKLVDLVQHQLAISETR